MPDLLPSIAALLDPVFLSDLLNRPVRSVREGPFHEQISSYSGSAITAVHIEFEDRDPMRLLLKRIAPAWDYFMRVTYDTHGRETLVWTTSILNRLPPEISHAYLACARDPDGAQGILMRNVAAGLFSRLERVSLDDHAIVLEGLAAFHTAGWEVDPGPGFTTPHDHYHVISPAAAATDPDQSGIMPRIVADGWTHLPDLLGVDLSAQLLALTNDPSPLVAALARFPQTIVHADVRAANLALEREPHRRLILLDWALPGLDVPGLDLVWYLIGLGDAAPEPIDASIARYRSDLASRLGARFDDAWWQPMLDLSMLGGLIRFGWIAARTLQRATTNEEREAVRASIRPWVERAERGLAVMRAVQGITRHSALGTS